MAADGRRFVVVGGGLAGITAALGLADAGATVTLLERRRDLGGLTCSYRRRGVHYDNGQHVFMRCCTAYLELLDRLGVRDRVTLQRRLDVPVLAPGRRPARIRRNALPAPFHLGFTLAGYRHLSYADRLRAAWAALALARLDPDDPALDRVEFGRWLEEHGQRPESVPALWDLIARPTINLRADEASLALAARVFRTGLLDEAGAGDIGWSLVPLGELHGDAARRALVEAGADVVTSCAVERVEPGSDGKPSVVTRNGLWECDGVIVAVPHRAVTSLLGSGAFGLHDPSSLGESPIVNVHLVYDRRVTDLPFAAAVDSPVEFVFDRTESARLERGQYLVVSLSAADRYVGAPPRELLATLSGALAELFPAASGAQVVDGFVSCEPAATFRGVPGSARHRPGPVTACANVYLAGAWTDTGWPATMEGAVRSGRAAARAALAGVPAPFRSNEEVVS
jgi:squalene-associated FAD-dependent desaturase